MRLSRNKKGKGYTHRSGQRYISIPLSIAQSESYLSLSGPAVKVLTYLLTKYNGMNNGNLSLTISECTNLTLARATLVRALKELQHSNFITKTRQGVFSNAAHTCSLFAINWQPIDFNSQDIKKG